MKKTKRTKAIPTILIIIAVVALAGLYVFGAYGGIGPFRFIMINKIAKLPGNSEEYRFDRIEPMENSPLSGKNIGVLGSSVVNGSAAQYNSVAEYLCARFGCNYTKEAVNGTTLVDKTPWSYVKRLKGKLDPNAEYDLFIVQLSTNDATFKLPLGEISGSMDLDDFDTSTVTGALEYIISYTKETWNCPVVFFTDSRYDSQPYGAMVERLLELQEKYDIGVLDLWSGDAFNNISDEMRSIYMFDSIHPTMAGYRDWWGPEMERQLLDYLSDLNQ